MYVCYVCEQWIPIHCVPLSKSNLILRCTDQIDINFVIYCAVFCIVAGIHLFVFICLLSFRNVYIVEVLRESSATDSRTQCSNCWIR